MDTRIQFRVDDEIKRLAQQKHEWLNEKQRFVAEVNNDFMGRRIAK
ncbi:hypothetical protein [Vibrio toranzoniae]|nr:hypothetical protein [Vibrio toranzoniae]SBS39529.1 hypothetical protein VTO7225_03646 [Vibrio toranzoniae]